MFWTVNDIVTSFSTFETGSSASILKVWNISPCTVPLLLYLITLCYLQYNRACPSATNYQLDTRKKKSIQTNNTWQNESKGIFIQQIQTIQLLLLFFFFFRFLRKKEEENIFMSVDYLTDRELGCTPLRNRNVPPQSLSPVFFPLWLLPTLPILIPTFNHKTNRIWYNKYQLKLSLKSSEDFVATPRIRSTLIVHRKAVPPANRCLKFEKSRTSTSSPSSSTWKYPNIFQSSLQVPEQSWHCKGLWRAPVRSRSCSRVGAPACPAGSIPM